METSENLQVHTEIRYSIFLKDVGIYADIGKRMREY